MSANALHNESANKLAKVHALFLAALVSAKNMLKCKFKIFCTWRTSGMSLNVTAMYWQRQVHGQEVEQ